ncbi:MAG: HYExAFE family protein [Gemmataceae bacterium]|nr:HYExAFE family protein [Gemmata sp.]MDW8197581.1 HYExAFE family protein [Gemmataceae bacterium]
MKADNHYEAAFDAFARRCGAAVVPVVETRRNYLHSATVKSPDFLVVAPGGAKLVVDVKGRKFPGTGKNGQSRFVWHNWCERESVVSLIAWACQLGAGFRGVLAFVYDLPLWAELPSGTPDLFAFRGRLYLLRGVAVHDYRAHMRTRSPRWGTVHLRTEDFRELVRPISHFLASQPVPIASSPATDGTVG